MAENENCQNCRFSVEKKIEGKSPNYECRRFPPTIYDNNVYYGRFPLVHCGFFCGEYQRKSENING